MTLLSRNIQSCRKPPKISVYWGNGVKVCKIRFRDPKRLILARKDVFWRTKRQNRRSGLGAGELEEPQKTSRVYNRQLRIYGGSESASRIVMQFCTEVDIRDLIIRAIFGDHRFGHCGTARGRISGFSVDLQRRSGTLTSVSVVPVAECARGELTPRRLCTLLSNDTQQTSRDSITWPVRSRGSFDTQRRRRRRWIWKPSAYCWLHLQVGRVF